MILQQLLKDSRRIIGEENWCPPRYDRQTIPWIVELNSAGGIVNVVRQTGSGDPKDRGKRMTVPVVRRSSGIRAALLADTASYALGISKDSRGNEDSRAAAKHTAFRYLLEKCVQETDSEDGHAVVEFLRRLNNREIPPEKFPEDLSARDWVTFSVDGRFPVDEPAIQRFWARECSGDGTEEIAETTCLVCGEKKIIESSLPTAIKPIPNGQPSGTALVSINSNTFESFGLSSGKTSGVCSDCGEVFGKALNKLLEDRETHLTIGGLVYVFWTRKDTEFSPFTFLDRPEENSVRELLRSYRSGNLRFVETTDANDFYATALSGSGGRAVVRDWLHTTVEIAKGHLGRWFALLEQVDAWGQPGKPLGLYQLAMGLYRDVNKDMSPQTSKVLFRAALHGDLLPDWLLTQALARCRAERDVVYSRAALIKAVLYQEEDFEKMSSLDLKEQSPAYLCGRLLSVLEQIQRKAIPGINATLVDRYFGTASTAPASVFGTLLSDAQNHLSKLRKADQSYYLELKLEEVLALLQEFPITLTLKDQALFSLGYYHQRAEDRAVMKERKAAKADTNEKEEV